MPPTGDPQARAPLALVAAGVCALVSAMAIGRFAYTPLLPYMQRDYGLSIAMAGYIASANFLGYLAGALLAMRVPLARRNRAYAAGLALSVGSTAAMAFVEGGQAQSVVRALGGAASAFVLIQGSAIALDALARANRSALFSLIYAGVGLGIALSAGLVLVLARAEASAQAMWLAFGVAAAVLALPALTLRDPAAAPVTTTNSARSVAPTSRRALAWLTAAYGSLGFGYVITMTFIVVIVRGRPDWQPYEMLVWMCVGLAGVPSNHLWGRLAQRLDPWRTMSIAFVLEAVGVAAAVSGSSLALVMLGGALLGGTFLGITALGLSTGRQLAQGDSGPVVARMTAAFGAGQILGPAIGGWAAERSGSFVGPSALAAATLLAAAVMIELSRRARPIAG
jgi:predicted MFS family arabinose efflux permease